MAGLVRVSVAEHVDRPCGEVLGVGLEVAHVRLGVTAGTVKKHQRRAARIARVQVAGAHSPRVEIALRERDALKIAPDALERRGRVGVPPARRAGGERSGIGHSSPSLDGENMILVFCKHPAHLSHIYVHYSQSITLMSGVCQGRGTRHMAESPASAAPNGAPGSQTLARGLAALQLVATSRSGLTVQQVADSIGVHRTIAYRLLTTL